MRVCSICGEKNEDWMNICQRCGNSVVNADNIANEDDYKFESVKKVQQATANTYNMTYNNNIYETDYDDDIKEKKPRRLFENLDLKIILIVLLIILICLLVYTIMTI